MKESKKGPGKTHHPWMLADESIEKLGPYYFIQKKTGFKLTQDPLLLSDFILPLKKDESIIDLGTGTGVIPLILAWKSETSKIVGVEVEKKTASIAMRNVESNDLGERIMIIERDFRELPAIYPEGSFSLVVSNPPYTKAGSGRLSPVKERALARSEVMGSLEELIQVSRHLAGKDGKIFYIFPVIRLFEMLDGFKKAGMKARRLKFIHTDPDKSAKLFMVEAGRKGKLKIEEPMFR